MAGSLDEAMIKFQRLQAMYVQTNLSPATFAEVLMNKRHSTDCWQTLNGRLFFYATFPTWCRRRAKKGHHLSNILTTTITATITRVAVAM